MIRLGTKLQLLAFLLITMLTVSLLSARYTGIYDRILGGAYTVTADFASSGGIFVGSEVSYRGVTVGRVEGLRLSQDGVLVDARIDRGELVPKDTIAVVENRSAVGEQYLDLQPRAEGGAMLADGDVIPRADTRTPLPIEDLLLNLDDTVTSVDQDDLRTVVDELGQAFEGSGPDLQRLLDNGDALIRQATESLPETVTLIDDGRIVLDTQRQTSGQILTFASNFKALSQTLKASDADLRLVLDRGVVASEELDGLIKENQGSLAALLANFITVGQVTTAHVDGITQLLVTYPDVVAGGYSVVPGDGTAHFGLQLAPEPDVCTQGYEGTQRQIPSDATNPAPVNTGARCTLPRGSASDVRGAQNAPPGNYPSSSAGSSYPLALGSQPVALGSSAGADDPSFATPTPPQGASATQSLAWMMTGGTSPSQQ